jgi:hypothetical protein
MAVVGASGGPAGRRRHPSNISFVDIHGNAADGGIKGGIGSGVKYGSLVKRWFFIASDAGGNRRWRKEVRCAGLQVQLSASAVGVFARHRNGRKQRPKNGPAVDMIQVPYSEWRAASMFVVLTILPLLTRAMQGSKKSGTLDTLLRSLAAPSDGV